MSYHEKKRDFFDRRCSAYGSVNFDGIGEWLKHKPKAPVFAIDGQDRTETEPYKKTPEAACYKPIPE